MVYRSIFTAGRPGRALFLASMAAWPGLRALAGDRVSWSIWAAHLMMKGQRLRDEDLKAEERPHHHTSPYITHIFMVNAMVSMLSWIILP